MTTATLNISLPIQREQIMNFLESQTTPKYTFVKMLNHMEAQYLVEDDDDHGDLLRYTKRLIHKTEFGSVIMFRVLYNGQFFEGGPILEDWIK